MVNVLEQAERCTETRKSEAKSTIFGNLLATYAPRLLLPDRWGYRRFFPSPCLGGVLAASLLFMVFFLFESTRWEAQTPVALRAPSVWASHLSL